MTIDHIVFDVGNVLIHWDAEIPYRSLIPDDANRREFLTTVCSPAWNLEQDRGRSWSTAEDVLIAEFPDKESLIRAFRQRWREMVPHAIAENVAVLAALVEDGRDVTALTNFNDDTFAEAQDMYPFLNTFRGITVSANVGLLKPEAEIFEHHTRAFSLKPENTLFFDDSSANVAAARKSGWQAEQVTGPTSIRDGLAKYRITLAA